MDDFNTKLQLLALGALVAGVVSLLVNMFSQWFMPLTKRKNLTKKVQMYQESRHGVHARCRVYNGGFWTMRNAMVYITLDVTEADTLEPPNGQDAFIKPGNFAPIESQQLVWSVHFPVPNPMRVDIFAKERQPFAPLAIDRDCIMLPSEKGWEFPKDGHRTARVFLRRKKYNGLLKVVSEDTDARYYELQIDPNDVEKPLTLRSLKGSEATEAAQKV